MPFSVLQLALEPVSADQLGHAFGQVPGLAALDASMLGNGAFGILARSLDPEQAGALKIALGEDGIEAEIVEDSALPVLPEARNVEVLESTPDALLIFDPLGRSFPLKWENIVLIAAGCVRTSDFKDINAPTLVIGGRGAMHMAYRHELKEQPIEHWLIDLVITGGALRYCVTVDQAAIFLMRYLGDRRTRNLPVDFQLVVQDLISHAPNAAVNRGAYCLRENFPQAFRYPNKTVFFNEIVWLLWKMK
jgi:hypothetical protein